MTDPMPNTAQYANTYRVMSLMMSSFVVVVAGVATFALTSPEVLPDQPLLLLVPPVVAAVLHLLVETIGYRTPALAPDATSDARLRAAQGGWQTVSILRLALTESLALLGLAAAFVISDGGVSILWVSAVLSLALMLFHGYPWSRPVLKVTAAQEANGVVSPLPEIFGVTRPDTVVQRR